MVTMFPWITLLVSLHGLTTGLDLGDCQDALGMQEGGIPDEAITASSSLTSQLGPASARIRGGVQGGAWCPKVRISQGIYEYLQIDLGSLKVITMVETQGRFNNGEGQEFADQYRLEYQREDDGPWFKFHNRLGREVFQGNTNTYIAEMRPVDPPIIARRVRFVPYSDHSRAVCMRVELHGCHWEDGTVSYMMPQGARRGSDILLYDRTYDGETIDKLLVGGLGQLTDGAIGQKNFRHMKGYEWVGWHNDSFGNDPVEIVFKFDDVRNFTSVQLHCSNSFGRDIHVFRMAEVSFSVGGVYYQGETVEYRFMRDVLIEYARNIVIPLENNVGRFVRVKLYFDSRWLMISEVQFKSEYAVGNFTEEMPPLIEARGSVDGESDPSPDGAGRSWRDGSVVSPSVVEVLAVPERKTNRTGLGGTGSRPQDEDRAHTPETRAREQFIGIIVGTLVALILLMFVIVAVIAIRTRRRRKYNNAAHKPIDPRLASLDLNHLHVGYSPAATIGVAAKVNNGNVYNGIAVSDGESDHEGTTRCCVALDGTARDYYQKPPFDGIQKRRLPELPRTPESSDTNTSREYAIPDLSKSALIINIPHTSTQSTATPYHVGGVYAPSPTVPPCTPAQATYGPPAGPYAMSDVAVTCIQGVSGNNVYSSPGNLDLVDNELDVIEFPRENLCFIERLGEGLFGEVHLCEAVRLTELLGDDMMLNRTTGSRSKLVAVKIMHTNANDEARRDFHKEVKMMARLKDPNIVRVLGMCTLGEPPCVIVEYMKYGDLHQYLRQHVLEESATMYRGAKTLSHGALIYVASQIASGMKYLESLNTVHRDLATRNCLVGDYFKVKISDFGMSRSLYSSDYLRIEGRAMLPIRWMAWEGILLGKFSTKSDIWSFGVTLWEVLTVARQQPFEGLSDEQVIDNSGHYYRNDGHERSLSQPGNCPREVYDLMRECWNREPAERPTFREIHMFLQRKNMGYIPEEEAMYKPIMNVAVV